MAADQSDSFERFGRPTRRDEFLATMRCRHVFAVVKRPFGLATMRDRGLEKNPTRAFVALGLANICLARGRLAG